LEVTQLDGPGDKSQGRPLRSSQLECGDTLAIRLTNTGYRPYWFTMFYLNGRLGIQHVQSGSIAGRDPQNTRQTRLEREVLRFEVNEQSVGTNGFITIAVSQREHANQPDYRYLGQGRIGLPGTRGAPPQVQPSTAFEALLLNTVSNQESFRGIQSPDEPMVASWSWVTEPGRGKP